jgi:hypothetical protein
MSQKRDVRQLNNENPVNRRIGGGSGLGNILDAIITFIKGPEALLTAALLAIGSSAKQKVKIVADPVYYRRDGNLKTIAGAEVAFTATGHDIQGHATLDKAAWYLIAIDDSDAYVIVKGATATAGLELKPGVPAGYVALGYVNILVEFNVSPAIFDATTDELDESHLTVVYEDAAVATDAIEALR